MTENIATVECHANSTRFTFAASIESHKRVFESTNVHAGRAHIPRELTCASRVAIAQFGTVVIAGITVRGIWVPNLVYTGHPLFYNRRRGRSRARSRHPTMRQRDTRLLDTR